MAPISSLVLMSHAIAETSSTVAPIFNHVLEDKAIDIQLHDEDTEIIIRLCVYSHVVINVIVAWHVNKLIFFPMSTILVYHTSMRCTNYWRNNDCTR